MGNTARRDRKENTKAVLLQRAYELFSQNGIANTRMSDIAQAAGVSHGTVFLHFQTQDLLIAQVVELYCGRIASRTHELADARGSLRDILTAHLKGIAEFEPFYTRLVIENRFLPSDARDAFVSLQSAISFHFSKAAGANKKLPPDMLFNMWMGLVHYYLANGDLFAPEGNVIKRYGKTLIESFLELICA